MSQENLNVNVQVIENGITSLKSLLEEVDGILDREFEILGAGYTKDWMELTNDNLLDLTSSLRTLMENTLIFLQDAKDGYIDTDEEISKAINAFVNEE